MTTVIDKSSQNLKHNLFMSRSCPTGYKVNEAAGICEDINECASNDMNDCLDTQRCDNTIGSYTCVRFTTCGTGYTLNYDTGECEDDDECALGGSGR